LVIFRIALKDTIPRSFTRAQVVNRQLALFRRRIASQNVIQRWPDLVFVAKARAPAP
jgi:hypothetical protein